MSTKFFALLTQLGADKLANAAALGTRIEITHMAVGDGGGKLPTPDTKQTKLINEKRRAAINTLSIDPKNTNQIIAEQVIPENEGGWWIREIGLFDKDGILIAVGNCAETYKPQLQEGSGRTQTIRMILIVSSADAVTLKVDPSVILATREYVDDSIQKHANSRNHPDATLKEKGFVILSSAVDSNSETHAATPKAVKAAYDFANAANNNANGRLEKNKNGADVADKDAFNHNIGSGRAFSGEVTIGGGGTWTTEEFIAWLKSKGAFNHPYWMCKGTWAYASNRRITDTGCGSIHLAGAVVEVMGIESVMTIRVTTAPTSVDGCIPNAQFTYGNHGKDYLPSWRRDYNTINKPTSDEVGAYSKSETDIRVNEAKDLANTRLEKSKNGADILNRDEFVKNLGLMETQNQARNAVPNSRRINGKSLVEDVTLSAADVKGEPRYNQTIDLTGLSTDRYYPVWWQFPSNGGANSWLTINRWYAEDREKDLFSKGEFHIAGLLLQIEGGDFIWGGDAKYLNIKRIRQTYRKTVKNVRHGMMSIARPIDGKYPLYENVKPGDIVYCKRFSGCYLRGGLTYHVTSNFSDVNYSRKDDEVEISSALEPQSNFEIKWMVKSYAIDDPILGKDYDDIVLPYAHDYAETINLAQNALPKSGGRVSGNITITTDSVIMFHRNSDWASLGFKNTDDSDTDSFMYFETGDNSNEYFKWRHQPYGKTAEDWMTLKRDNLRIKGHQVYHEGNTTVVDGGYLKKASPIINIWGNGEFATNAESTGSIVERLSEGVYLIKGVLGFNADTAWGGSDGGIEIPLCKNKLPLIWIDYQVQSNGLIKLMVYHREHTKVPEFAQNVHPDYSDGDLIDIPIGRFISIRVQMPEDSIWNKKLREFSEML